MKTINWGIIGTGNIAAEFAENLKFSKVSRCHAILSRTSENAFEFARNFGIPKTYTSLDEFLSDQEVDIIYIATPHSEHYSQMKAAILAKKDVICEKPLTINVKQAKEIKSLSEQSGIFSTEAMTLDFSPVICKAFEWIDGGKIGDIREIFVTFHIPNDSSPEGRLLNPMLGGGAMLDIGIYPIYLANRIFGSNPVKIETDMKLSETGVDMDSCTILGFSGGKRAVISCGLDYHASNHAVIIGEKGMITIPDFSESKNAYLFCCGRLEEHFSAPEEPRLLSEINAFAEREYSNLTEAVNRLSLIDAIRKEWNFSYPEIIESIHNVKPAAEILHTSQNPDWFRDSVFYHIYPLGFCGAPASNDFKETENRIRDLIPYAEHISNSGFNALYLGPVFESSAHGYDTADYRICDRRLGTNDDLKAVVAQMHKKGIKVIFDGVFNHVGRDFWAFQDVKTNRWNSPYKDWFIINFDANSNYNDGFWYEGWEGHFELVKLNLNNPGARRHVLDCAADWIEEFDIDGLRLDVAYCLSHDFLRDLRSTCNSRKENFFLLGETLHGDYSQYCKPDMLDSVTNYECYKGLYSSVNEKNMHEIGYSLKRQFSDESWTIYKNLPLYAFLDNHDVSRISSILKNSSTLKPLYSLLYSMPGIPSVYYASEWGVNGDKKDGDFSLRPEIDVSNIPFNELTNYIARLGYIRRSSPSLCRGNYRQLYIQSEQLIFSREFEGERIIAAFNFSSLEHIAHFNAGAGMGVDLISNEKVDFGGGLRIPAFSALIVKV